MKEKAKTFYKIQHPIFSFDVYNNTLVAIIYQSNGENVLSIRNIKLNEELFYYCLKNSSLNVKIRFLNNPNKVAFFDNNEAYEIDISIKKLKKIKGGVNCLAITNDKIITLLKNGEVYLISPVEDLFLGRIEGYNYKKEIDFIQTVDFSYQTGQVVLGYKNEIYLTNYRNKTTKIKKIHSLNEHKIKQMTYDYVSNFLVCIVEDKNKLISFKLVNEDILQLNDFFNIENSNYIKIINETEDIIVASNTGYLTIVNMKSLEILFSERMHSGAIRDIIINDKTIYTSGDDGHICKSIIS